MIYKFLPVNAVQLITLFEEFNNWIFQVKIAHVQGYQQTRVSLFTQVR